MAKFQFSQVNSKRGAPMGRVSTGVVAESIPRTVRLFKVDIDSRGYDNGGAYWGHGQQLWCAIGKHEKGVFHREFIRADSREHAIIGLKIESGVLIQGPTLRRLALLRRSALYGNVKAREMVKNLNALGYNIPYNPAENQKAKGF